MFSLDPFDIAPRARRHAPASWIVLAAGTVVAMLGVLALFSGFEALSAAEDLAAESKARRQASRRAEAVLEGSRAKLSPQAVKILQELNPHARVSWHGLLDLLESAGKEVEGGAVVVTLAPATQEAGRSQITMTGLAVSTPMMINYIRALERQPRIAEVRLATQQPAREAGAEVVRFQFSMILDTAGAPASQPTGPGVTSTAAGRRN